MKWRWFLLMLFAVQSANVLGQVVNVTLSHSRTFPTIALVISLVVWAPLAAATFVEFRKAR